MFLTDWKSPSSVLSTIDNFFDNLFGKDFAQRFIELGTTVPAVNINQRDDAYIMDVAVPGVKKEDIKIDINNNVLSISSESKQEKEEKEGEKVTRREYSYSSFRRTFQLPEDVKIDDITAEYKDGVLKVTLPKLPEKKDASKKQIEIK